jgi:hypothetical protein
LKTEDGSGNDAFVETIVFLNYLSDPPDPRHGVVRAGFVGFNGCPTF